MKEKCELKSSNHLLVASNFHYWQQQGRKYRSDKFGRLVADMDLLVEDEYERVDACRGEASELCILHFIVEVSSSGLQSKDFLKFSVDCTHARPFSALVPPFSAFFLFGQKKKKQGTTHQYVCRELSQDRHVCVWGT